MLGKLWTRFLLNANIAGKLLAVRMTRWTGKSKVNIHPKNLARPVSADWYMEHVPAGSHVLDVGCGSGTHAVACAAVNARVEAFDYSEKNLAVSREVCREHGDRISLYKGDAEKTWAVKPGVYDVVLLLDILEHLHNRSGALEETKRVLKPGGTAILSLPKVDTRWKERQKRYGLPHYTDPDHKIEYTDETLREEFERAGLEIVWGPDPIVYDTPLAGWIDMVGGISLTLYRRLIKWKRDMALKHPDQSIGYRLVVRKNGAARLT